jgi:hypothetical protein
MRGDIIQVNCPKCSKTGLLQTITPRFHRIRHTIKVPYFSRGVDRICYNREFVYCRVETEWAIQQLENERLRNEALEESYRIQ